MAIWITSDTHFYHNSITRLERYMLDKSGYSYIQTVEQYNEMVLRNINMCVHKDDTLYILGDFCFGSFEQVKEMYSRIRCHVILILGNHDHYTVAEGKKRAGIKEIYEGPIYMPGSKGKVILSHYPVKEAYHNPYVFNLHGHLHGSVLAKDMGNFINVAIGVNNFEPLRLDKLIDKALNSVKSRHERWLEEWFAEGYQFIARDKDDIVTDSSGRIKLEETKELNRQRREMKK